jgi:hypothetical protein
MTPTTDLYQQADRQAEGERRKLGKLALLEARRECFVRRGQRALVAKVLATGYATADDVRAAVAMPDAIDARCLGAVPGPLARAGIIRLAEYVKTARPERHASIIGRRELIDAQAARQWLATHPDLPDPEPDDGDDCGNLFPVDPSLNKGPTAATVGQYKKDLQL